MSIVIMGKQDATVELLGLLTHFLFEGGSREIMILRGGMAVTVCSVENCMCFSDCFQYHQI